jgi:excinuclease UvrABC nuclease subunit
MSNSNLKRKEALLNNKHKRTSKKLSIVLEDEIGKFEDRTEEIVKVMKNFGNVHKASIEHIQKKIYFKECE